MASTAERARAGAAAAITNPPCAYADSISALERLAPTRSDDAFDCNYALGERFFLSLYRSIGDAAFREGFRNLYLAAQVEDDADDYACAAVGINHIRAAFRGRAAGVNDAIARWYDGVLSDRTAPPNTTLVNPNLPGINGRILAAYITIGENGPAVSDFSARSVND